LIFYLSTLLADFAGFLAQEQGGGQGGAAGPQGGAQNAGGQGGGSLLNLLMPLMLCFVVFYFLLIMPERRKQKARVAMIKNVKKGDQVVTTAGIIGKVTRVDERDVVVQVDKDNDVRIHFLKSAIHEVIPEGGSPDAASPPKMEETK
jgi:preprotein translocase subunit YajC